jgi:mono/diheme cytochrome c family protein
MLRGRLLGVVCCSLAATAACAGGLPHPTQIDVERARAEDPSVTLLDLERGRSTYMQRCAGCHALRDPGALTPEAWPGAVDKMQGSEHVRLSAEERSDILRYLRAASAVAQRARQ